MRFRLAPLPLAAVAVSLSATAYAQTSRDFCDDLFTALNVGEYAEWTFRMADEREMSITMGVADSETRDGRELYWLEMTMPMPAAGIEIAAQMLVPGFPFDADEMIDYIIQYGDQAPLRVPPSEMGSLPGEGWREECRSAKAEYLGMEEVTIEGVGTFRAHHIRTPGEQPGHWYFSPAVPFSMLKFEATEGIMVVTEIGYDYTARIDRSAVE